MAAGPSPEEDEGPARHLRLLRRRHPRLVRAASASKQRPIALTQVDAMDLVQKEDLASLKHSLTGELTPTMMPELSWPLTSSLHSTEAVSVECPHCTRRFSAEAAERHIPICGKLRSKPKPPVKDAGSCFTDALGRRHGSRGALASGAHGDRSSSVPCGAPRAPNDRSSPTTPTAGTMQRVPTAQRRALPAEPLTGGKPPSQNAAAPGGDLGAVWFQVQVLLQDSSEAMGDEKSIKRTLSRADQCLSFLDRLEECAARLQMRKGQLSRLLLPFNSETSSGDQASTAMPLGDDALAGKLSDSERRELVSQAVTLRKLIRVKVADCADVEQARAALTLISRFIRCLQAEAASSGCNIARALAEL
mmetsp:Transcript_13342/g.31253  ORF Transcript_13342/g.31253 Transcript_13342/m.31253 type:complete len:362 (+) Transcript_13342:83-1168(+)